MSAKFRPICLKFRTVAVFLLFFQLANSQDQFSPAAAIVEQQAKILKKEVVLVVASKDTTLYTKDSKTFGAARGQAPLGYSSQWLTAALVMVLVDEGKLSLDDRVSKYLPVVASYGKSYITLRHCLSHFTGIQPEGPKVVRLFDKKKFANLEEVVESHVQREIQNNAGEAFRFNGMGPDIAGRVLEVVTKKKFDMLAQQKLFRPLGMRQTTFATLDGSAVSPSVGARGTAADYTRFLRMLLNGGLHNGQRVLSENAVVALRTVLTAASNIQSAPAEANGWAYTLGAWTPNAGSGLATALSAPSFEGTAPYLDFCRGYAFMYLQQELSSENKLPVYTQLRNALEPLFPSDCR